MISRYERRGAPLQVVSVVVKESPSSTMAAIASVKSEFRDEPAVVMLSSIGTKRIGTGSVLDTTIVNRGPRFAAVVIALDITSGYPVRVKVRQQLVHNEGSRALSTPWRTLRVGPRPAIIKASRPASQCQAGGETSFAAMWSGSCSRMT